MRRCLIVAFLLIAFCGALDAYVFLGQVWPDGSIVMQMQLGSSSGTLIDGSTSWGQSAEGSLATWNNYLNRVQFRVVRDSTAATGDNNGSNNVFFSSSIYGRSFGSSTLAVTTNWYRLPNTRIEADVIFNTVWSWNSYSGALRRAAAGGTLYDLRRVALHEFGHVLGLDHPDQYGQSVSAIMNSTISDTDSLQNDDVAGVRALYGTGGTPTSAPGPPSGLSVSSSGSTVTLRWNAPSSGGTPTAYVVEAGSAAGFANLANFSTGNTSTTFSASGVGAGSYYVRVKASNSSGTSAASNEALLVVGGGCAGAPSAPSGFTLTANSGGTVSFAWNASSSATTYIVEAGSTPGAVNLANSDLGSSATSATFSGIGAGTYYVRLRARNACGTSGASNEVILVVGGSTPTTLSITSWGAQFTVSSVSGGYRTIGYINMTLNNPVTGTYRGEFNSYGFIGGTATFSNTRNLSFNVDKSTSACPDLHGTIPLYLYNSSNQIVASVQAPLHGTGCAFDPVTGISTVSGSSEAR